MIPCVLEAAGVLATFAHPNHLPYVSSSGLVHLPPTCNSNAFGDLFYIGRPQSRATILLFFQ
ncbi:hypothetical protein DXZ79_00465 [Yersinia rochesterensis]|uniref:Uncharacterized protein n=1 Tax=Yersinia rochesterensis TaxID=1604335 RepID=A0A8D4MWS5_9GAMM|nr:hypothetical protein DXZ79_00465 [Yersinia rochesterensis]